MTTEVILALVAIVATPLSAWLGSIFTRQKYAAEVKSLRADVAKKQADNQGVELDNVRQGNEILLEQIVKPLKTEIKTYAMMSINSAGLWRKFLPVLTLPIVLSAMSCSPMKRMETRTEQLHSNSQKRFFAEQTAVHDSLAFDGYTRRSAANWPPNGCGSGNVPRMWRSLCGCTIPVVRLTR